MQKVLKSDHRSCYFKDIFFKLAQKLLKIAQSSHTGRVHPPASLPAKGHVTFAINFHFLSLNRVVRL